VQNAYTLAFGGLLLLGARAGDILGRRRMFIAGLALFTLASPAIGLAQLRLFASRERATAYAGRRSAERRPAEAGTGGEQAARGARGALQAGRLRSQGYGALIGEPVVAAWTAVDRLLVVDLDHGLGDQPIQGRIEGAGLEPHLAVGELRDMPDHPVPMSGCVDEGREDPERGFAHGPAHDSQYKYDLHIRQPHTRSPAPNDAGADDRDTDNRGDERQCSQFSRVVML
jgi:hypothetical protein